VGEVTLVPPPSKSDAERALILADILGVPPPPGAEPGPDSSSDVEVVRRGLEVLRAGGGELDCRDGGAPFRFLLTQAALTPGAVTRFVGTKRLGERPHRPLLEALRCALGPRGLVIEEGSPWPLVVRAPMTPLAQEFLVSGNESSQFASSLLLGAARQSARTARPCGLLIDGVLASRGYFDLTMDWVRRAGFRVSQRECLGEEPFRFRLDADELVSSLPAIPGDWSSLTVLLPLAWKTQVAVDRVDPRAVHPDALALRHFASVGLSVQPLQGTQVCRVDGTPRGGLSVDASLCPDAVPALAALACALPEASAFTRTDILRAKESDRVAGLAELAARVGASARVEGSTLTIVPGRAAARFDFDARDDHRLAMAAALASVLTGSELGTLTGAHSVTKSFPGFWREIAKVHPPFARFITA
jgi:3-phosphoshikimate 1-carboxyvinyltransferase